MMRRGLVALTFLVGTLPFVSVPARSMPNLALPTIGGQEFWTDYAIRDGARVQCHALTHHCRLLDGEDIRRGWGSKSEMLTAFNAMHPATSDATARHPAVILVHGLAGNDITFHRLKAALAQDGVKVYEFSYASAFTRFNDQSTALRDYMTSLDQVSDITFVTHSMGGLVVDQMMASHNFSGGPHKIAGVVRLGSPMAGSSLARRILSFVKPETLSGTPLAEVAEGRPAASLNAVSVPQCNIAGSLNNGRGLNPWVPGDDDGIVGVSEVSRGIRSNIVVVAASHYALTGDPTAIRTVLNFVKSGACGPV